MFLQFAFGLISIFVETISTAGFSSLLIGTNYFFYSIRIFAIAAVICFLLVLPVNYYGQEMRHKQIPSESLDVFTIENVKEGSKWYKLYTLNELDHF